MKTSRLSLSVLFLAVLALTGMGYRFSWSGGTTNPSGGGGGGSVTLSCSASVTSGAWPLSVLVDCTGSTYTGGLYGDLQYSYDFQSTLTGNWATASQPLSKDDPAGIGAYGGVIYPEAAVGSRTITIVGTAPDGASDSEQIGITVTNPYKRHCYSTQASPTWPAGCSGLPGAQLHPSTTDPFAAIATTAATEGGDANLRHSFLRGDTFQYSSTKTVAWTGPVVVDAVGSGALPIFTDTRSCGGDGAVHSSINFNNPLTNVSFQQIHFKGNGEVCPPVTAQNDHTILWDQSSVGVTGLACYGCQFTDGHAYVQMNQGPGAGSFAVRNRRISFVDTVFMDPKSTSENGTMVRVDGSETLLLGNQLLRNGDGVTDGVGVEHGIRSQLFHRSLMAANFIYRWPPGRVAVTIRSCQWMVGCDGNGNRNDPANYTNPNGSTEFDLTHNLLVVDFDNSGTNGLVPIAINPQGSTEIEWFANVSLIRNLVTGTHRTAQQNAITVVATKGGLWYRDNVVDGSWMKTTGGTSIDAFFYDAGNTDPDIQHSVERGVAVGNTYYIDNATSGQTATLVNMNRQGTWNPFWYVANNLVVTTGSTMTPLLHNQGADATRNRWGNSTSGQGSPLLTSSPFVSLPPVRSAVLSAGCDTPGNYVGNGCVINVSLANYKVTSSGAADGTGVVLPKTDDPDSGDNIKGGRYTDFEGQVVPVPAASGIDEP